MNAQDVQNALDAPRYFEAIMACGVQGEIGQDGKMPWECEGDRLKHDLRRFKDLTLGKVVIMGRKTWESLPGALKGRSFIVLTESPMEAPKVQIIDEEHCVRTMNLRHLPETLNKYYPDEDTIMVAGGAQIYTFFAPLVSRYHITAVEREYPNADVRVMDLLMEVGRWHCDVSGVVVEDSGANPVLTRHELYTDPERLKACAVWRIQNQESLSNSD